MLKYLAVNSWPSSTAVHHTLRGGRWNPTYLTLPEGGSANAFAFRGGCQAVVTGQRNNSSEAIHQKN